MLAALPGRDSFGVLTISEKAALLVAETSVFLFTVCTTIPVVQILMGPQVCQRGDVKFPQQLLPELLLLGRVEAVQLCLEPGTETGRLPQFMNELKAKALELFH